MAYERHPDGPGTSKGTALPTLRVVGAGRAGMSLGTALSQRGWVLAGYVGRVGDIANAAAGVDLCVIATPDAAIQDVAALIAPDDRAVVAHLAGARGLDALTPHPRRASLHPLVALPDARRGAEALLAGAWFAVEGDPLARAVVESLGGRCVEVDPRRRSAYHAAACIASNHLVALLAQVERVGEVAGVPLSAFFSLVRATIDNVELLGPPTALTGPVARGDWETVSGHLRAIGPAESDLYVALARAAADLAGRSWPEESLLCR